MWFLKISNGGNPLLAEELTMREVISEIPNVFLEIRLDYFGIFHI